MEIWSWRLSRGLGCFNGFFVVSQILFLLWTFILTGCQIQLKLLRSYETRWKSIWWRIIKWIFIWLGSSTDSVCWWYLIEGWSTIKDLDDQIKELYETVTIVIHQSSFHHHHNGSSQSNHRDGFRAALDDRTITIFI